MAQVGIKEKLINTLNQCRDNNISEQLSLLEQDSIKKYVIGKNEQTLELLDKYKITAIIDDYSASTNNHWSGRPVVTMDSVDRDSVVINTASSIAPVSANRRLVSLGFKNIINLHQLISCDNKIIDLPSFVASQHHEVYSNLDWWVNFSNELEDSESKNIFSDLALYRLTADLSHMNAYTVRLRDQYFERFMNYEREYFVDAGGFNGDTTEEFIKHCPDYKKIYFFEPSKRNMSAALDRLNGLRDIEFKSHGLSDLNGFLTFNSDAGSASCISSERGDTISVVSLDNELNGLPVTFIKMDLEGWEMHALRGAQNIIMQQRPKLAIAVYHNSKDFREVPEFLKSLHPDYKIYLRHYSEGWSESVMYFV